MAARMICLSVVRSTSFVAYLRRSTLLKCARVTSILGFAARARSVFRRQCSPLPVAVGPDEQCVAARRMDLMLSRCRPCSASFSDGSQSPGRISPCLGNGLVDGRVKQLARLHGLPVGCTAGQSRASSGGRDAGKGRPGTAPRRGEAYRSKLKFLTKDP